MGIFASIFTAIISAVSSGWNRYQETKAVEHQSKIELIKAQTAVELKQLDNNSQQTTLNSKEAESESIFVAGWRPFVGWGCGVITILNGSIYFIAAFLSMFGIHIVVPDLTSANMLVTNILTGMLGLGMATLRSYDKKQLLNMDKLYNSFRGSLGGKLTTAQVDMINKAINDATSENN